MGERIFKRGLIWYAWVPKPGGGVERKTTLCTDKKAALIVAAKLERAAVDPGYAAQNEAETASLLTSYVASRERLGRSEGTMHHVNTKAGHLFRLLPARAAEVTHEKVEGYIDMRLQEGARRTTIKKELRVLKATLRLAAKKDLFKADPNNIIPELEDDYVPRTRFLLPMELVGLVGALGGDPRAATVAFIVATSARWGEAQRARREDVFERDGVLFVKLRGTKTKKSKREVPILGAATQILRWSLARAGKDELFPAWGNVRRDLHAACKRLGIPTCSPNDLRRTFATWMQQAGAGNDLIAKAMGHADTRQVERTYGQMTPDDLARLITKRTVETVELRSEAPGAAETTEPTVGPGSLEAHINGDANLSPAARTALLAITRAAYLRLSDGTTQRGLLMGCDPTGPEHSEAFADSGAASNQAENTAFAVPRDGIEPPTRGFSIRASEEADRAAGKAWNATKRIAQSGWCAANGKRLAADGIPRRISFIASEYVASEWSGGAS